MTRLPDQDAREFAVDPRENVALEASAGTGKTTVLVRRYLRLLGAGVDPANILAITFTRKAASEMRERIVAELKREADRSAEGRKRWRELRDRLADIAISTIDAFCLGLLREFPLEAGLDPSFTVADETEAARLASEAIDRALRIGQSLTAEDAGLALLFSRLPIPRLRDGLAHLLDRRLVAGPALAAFVARASASSDHADRPDALLATVVRDLTDAFERVPGGVEAFASTGPVASARFRALVADLRRVLDASLTSAGPVRGTFERLRRHVLTDDGRPRRRLDGYRQSQCASAAAARHHVASFAQLGPILADADARATRGLNLVLARGVQRVFLIAEREYRRAMASANLVDFSDALERAVALLGQMDEFAQSRFRLESRFHHLLVDEFQDTSRKQWELVWRLVESWGEGAGLVSDAPLPPSIFIVGDRKQSIYRFRDAETAVLHEASRFIAGLRQSGAPHRSIRTSFRSRPDLLSFVNDLFADIAAGPASAADAFTFEADDAFPLEAGAEPSIVDTGLASVAVIAQNGLTDVATTVAGEIRRLIGSALVRDRETGVARAVAPGDIAVLFRSRETHRAFEQAIDAIGVRTYVYKGLGFFDADEIQDVTALIRFLAAPWSAVRAAAFLRTRLVRLSDVALATLAPDLEDAVRGPLPHRAAALDAEDRRVLDWCRGAVARWLPLVDRVPPAELVDLVLAESAYAWELGGARAAQARENVKKVRALVRRIQNAGYATMADVAAHLDRMSAGDESSAVIDAHDAVHLMTVHAAKGLEFPIVFLVGLGRGIGGHAPAVRVVEAGGRAEVSIDGLDEEADERERERELEETKRLLYVALTRARDRVYFVAQLTEGRFQPSPGSLGAVLPESLRAAIAAAAAAPTTHAVEWRAGSGRAHALLVPPATPVPAGEPVVAVSQDVPVAAAREAKPPLVRHVSVIDLVRGDVTGASVRAPADDEADIVSGRIVHRLFRLMQNRALDPAAVHAAAKRLALVDPALGGADVELVATRASAAFLRLRGRDDVSALLESGEVWYEVPFSVRSVRSVPDAAGADATAFVVRGAIDCLVRTSDREWTVVEFKTGREAAWHMRQLSMYVDAVRAMWPEAAVSGRLIYPSTDSET